MYTHKIVLLALCQFTRNCGATWLKVFTYYFRAMQNVINAVRTKSITTSGLFFASLTPYCRKSTSLRKPIFRTPAEGIAG